MTRKVAALLSLSLSLAYLAACDALLTKPSLYNTVEVIATRRNGDPIPGVDLSLYTGQRAMDHGVTGPDGRLSFHKVPQGEYGVFATPPAGYDAIEHLAGGPPSVFVDGLHLVDDTLSPVRFTFLKQGQGTVTVRVVQPDGSPIPGAVVTAFDSTNAIRNATTNASGIAVFSSVPFGLHSVVVRRFPGDSLDSRYDNIVVEEGSQDSVIFKLDVSLVPESGPASSAMLPRRRTRTPVRSVFDKRY